MPREKLQDQLGYPPRGMRAERAAAYLDMSKSTFLELVDEGILPKPRRVRGIVVWDRLDLDSAFDDLRGTDDDKGKRENTVHRLLGIRREKEHP
jgi:predicted DNA-binding transcriptional regulator AlpA